MLRKVGHVTLRHSIYFRKPRHRVLNIRQGELPISECLRFDLFEGQCWFLAVLRNLALIIFYGDVLVFALMLGLPHREFEVIHICDEVRFIDPTMLHDFVDLFLISHRVFMVIVGVSLQFAGLRMGRALFKLFDPFFYADLLIRLWSLSKR